MPRRPDSSPAARAVFRALVDQDDEWCHGYRLARLTGLKSGTLYPILARLSDAALLDAKWEDGAPQGRPPRHLYRLTPAGAAVAARIPAEEPKSSPLRRLRPAAEGG